MSISLQPLHQLQQDLQQKNLVDRYKTIPSVKKWIFEDRKNPLDRVVEAIEHLTILEYLKGAKSAFIDSNPTRAYEFFNKANQFDSEDLYFVSEVSAVVYRKMDELLGNLDIPNHGSRVFNAPTAVTSLKLVALEAGITFFENHWSNTVLKDLEDGLQTDYNALIARIKERGVSPLAEDNPVILNGIVKDFIKAFDQAPESEKKKLASAPLYPSYKNPGWTKPLNYIMFTGNYEALIKIVPYLDDSDWRALGPYESTFFHCIISGIEKNTSSKNSPVECIKMLLKKVPGLKYQANRVDTTPLEYLKTVQEKLEGNLDHIRSKSRGGYSGLNPLVSTNDCKGGRYNETAYEYDRLIVAAKEIEKMLSCTSRY